MRKDNMKNLTICLMILAAASSSSAEDAYIEATGTQAISLGCKMTASTRWEVDFEMTDYATTQQRIFGANSGDGKLELYINGSGQWSFGAKAGGYATALAADGVRHIAIGDPTTGKGYIVTDGVTNGTSASTFTLTGESSYPIALFGIAKNEAGTAFENWGFANARIYGFRIWRDGSLAMHGVPAIKDGQPGFRDVAGGGFYTNGIAGTTLLYGGDIARLDDAYLSSTGDQIVNTSRSLGLKTRVEVDFALNSHEGCQERIFGATKATDFVYGLYCNGQVAGAGNFAIAAGDYVLGSFPGYDTGVAVDLNRHKAIIDMKNAMMYFITGSTTNYSHAIDNATKASSWLMGLFGEPYTADFSGTDHRSDMRLYSCKVYDDDVLKQHWLPYKDASRIGLKNVVTGDIRTDGRAAATPFTVGGCGWGEDGAVFYENPTNAVVGVNQSTSLSAYAPAATSYQWLVGGEPAANATNMTFDIAWRRSRTPVPVSVLAYFNLGGVVEPRESEVALITMNPTGIVLVVK